MTTTIISNNPPYNFGQQTNQTIAKLISLNTQMIRLGEAVATASSGYAGVAGTEFELPAPGVMPIATQSNLFGVTPSATPGEQGLAFSYALNQLFAKWQPFWTEAQPFIEQLDNGQVSM